MLEVYIEFGAFWWILREFFTTFLHKFMQEGKTPPSDAYDYAANKSQNINF